MKLRHLLFSYGMQWYPSCFTSLPHKNFTSYKRTASVSSTKLSREIVGVFWPRYWPLLRHERFSFSQITPQELVEVISVACFPMFFALLPYSAYFSRLMKAIKAFFVTHSTTPSFNNLTVFNRSLFTGAIIFQVLAFYRFLTVKTGVLVLRFSRVSCRTKGSNVRYFY